jgi:hypothetical protein
MTTFRLVSKALNNVQPSYLWMKWCSVWDLFTSNAVHEHSPGPSNGYKNPRPKDLGGVTILWQATWEGIVGHANAWRNCWLTSLSCGFRKESKRWKGAVTINSVLKVEWVFIICTSRLASNTGSWACAHQNILPSRPFGDIEEKFPLWSYKGTTKSFKREVATVEAFALVFLFRETSTLLGNNSFYDSFPQGRSVFPSVLHEKTLLTVHPHQSTIELGRFFVGAVPGSQRVSRLRLWVISLSHGWLCVFLATAADFRSEQGKRVLKWPGVFFWDLRACPGTLVKLYWIYCRERENEHLPCPYFLSNFCSELYVGATGWAEVRADGEKWVLNTVSLSIDAPGQAPLTGVLNTCWTLLPCVTVDLGTVMFRSSGAVALRTWSLKSVWHWLKSWPWPIGAVSAGVEERWG